MALPRSRQPGALAALRAALPAPPAAEAWNTAFGPDSLFDAWTRSSVAQSLYRANRAVLAPRLAGREGWRILEVGGGDGRLWRGLFADLPEARGELWVVDPSPEVGPRVAAALPAGVTLEHLVRPVEGLVAEGPAAAALPACDLVVCSLTLHHVAGRSAAERARVGLEGPGKGEILAALGRCLAERDGLLLLNEADIHCEVDLPARDPVLRERLLDSYVRRCARSLLHDVLERDDAEEGLRARWLAVAHRWCLDQVAMAEVPLPERDVYELDVGRWLELFAGSGLEVREHGFSDPWMLFHQYLLAPRTGSGG